MSKIAYLSECEKPDLNWFAIQVRSRYESRVATALQQKGIESLLPFEKVRKQWCDRVHLKEVPLFPGYVFGRFDVRRRMPILVTPGVYSIVGYAKEPNPIPHEEISAIKTIMESNRPVRTWPYFAVGQKVRIERGPLYGLEGVLVQIRSSWRVVVSVDLIQRSISVEVDCSMLERATPAGALAKAAGY